MSFPDGETWLFWQKSTDTITAQSLIKYEVYLNGVLDHVVAGARTTVLYAEPAAANRFEVVAVDQAGNRSANATLVIDLCSSPYSYCF